jgi:hypothetical protein
MPTTSSRSSRVRVSIRVRGEKRVLEALRRAVDESRIVGSELVIESSFEDVGDARAFLNSTLRVINASVNSLE